MKQMTKWRWTAGVGFLFTLSLVLNCGGSSSTTSNAPAGSLVSIAVTPNSPSAPAGTVQQLTATGTYSDFSTRDITSQVTWTSSNTTTATIDGSGLASAKAKGTTTIIAASGGKSGQAFLTVTSAPLRNVATIAGTASGLGSADGVGAAASFNYPAGITTDGTNLYVTEFYGHTIRKIAIATGAVTTLAGTPGASGSADGTGARARFNNPYGIATDGTNLYVADSGNHTIRKIVIATGAVTTLAGTPGNGGATDGTGTAALFSNPSGITTDPDNKNLYLTDSNNDTIRKIVVATGAVTTIAGTPGATGSADGTGAAATFHQPVGIATDGSNLYVADTGNSTIRKVVIGTGAVTTVAGNAGNIGFTDGIGPAAGFNNPAGITTDGTNFYVADTLNSTIRQVVISTRAVTTLTGTPLVQGSADGSLTVATFFAPFGITTDGTNLYVADTYNYTIRKIY